MPRVKYMNKEKRYIIYLSIQIFLQQEVFMV